MKHLFTIIALGSAAFVSADQYNQPSCKTGNCPYQQQNRPSYHQQQNQPQNRPGYYQQQGSQQLNQQQGRTGYYDQQSQPKYYQDRNQARNMNNDNDDYDDNDDGDDTASSDLAIFKKAQSALSSGLFSSGYEHVFFDVDDGYITLRGTVDTAENKDKIEKNMKDIEGVKGVTNKITVTDKHKNLDKNADKIDDKTRTNPNADKMIKEYPQDSAASQQDKELNAKIRERLASWLSSRNVEAMMIKTKNGEVIILGTVEKPEDVEKVNYQLKDIQGIKNVDNQLKVKK